MDSVVLLGQPARGLKRGLIPRRLIGRQNPGTNAPVNQPWHIVDRARLRERFHGATRTVLARL